MCTFKYIFRFYIVIMLWFCRKVCIYVVTCEQEYRYHWIWHYFESTRMCQSIPECQKFLSIIWLWSEHNMVQMDRCKLTLDLPKFQPMKEQDSHLLSNQRPALTLDLPKVIIAPPSDNGLVFWTSEAISTFSCSKSPDVCLSVCLPICPFVRQSVRPCMQLHQVPSQSVWAAYKNFAMLVHF